MRKNARNCIVRLKRKNRVKVMRKGVFVKNSNCKIIPNITKVKETIIEKKTPVINQLTQNAELLNPMMSKL